MAAVVAVVLWLLWAGVAVIRCTSGWPSASTRRNRLPHLDPGLAREIPALGGDAVAEQATEADGMSVTECTSSTLSGCGCAFDIYDTAHDASIQAQGDC